MFRSRRRFAPRHLAGARLPATPQQGGPEPTGEELLSAHRVPGHRLAFAVASTFAAVPILVVDNLPMADGVDPAPLPVEAAGADVPPMTTTTVLTVTTAVPAGAPATTTTQAPTTTTQAPTTTTAAPTTTRVAPTATAVPATAAPVAPKRSTTTTTAPPAQAAPAPNGSTESGEASWYRQPSRFEPGGCAHRTLPFGTVVTITSHHDGRTATCTVSDRGPFVAGRIIDLDDDVYAQLAPLSTGVIDVTITW